MEALTLNPVIVNIFVPALLVLAFLSMCIRLIKVRHKRCMERSTIVSISVAYEDTCGSSQPAWEPDIEALGPLLSPWLQAHTSCIGLEPHAENGELCSRPTLHGDIETSFKVTQEDETSNC